MLRRIVFSPFDFITPAAADPTLDGVWDNDDPAPFLVLYQHGKSVWAGPSETQVSCFLCAAALLYVLPV